MILKMKTRPTVRETIITIQRKRRGKKKENVRNTNCTKDTYTNSNKLKLLYFVHHAVK